MVEGDTTKFNVKHQGKDIHHPPSTIYKWHLSDLPRLTLCPSLSLSFTTEWYLSRHSYTSVLDMNSLALSLFSGQIDPVIHPCYTVTLSCVMSFVFGTPWWYVALAALDIAIILSSHTVIFIMIYYNFTCLISLSHGACSYILHVNYCLLQIQNEIGIK